MAKAPGKDKPKKDPETFSSVKGKSKLEKNAQMHRQPKTDKETFPFAMKSSDGSITLYGRKNHKWVAPVKMLNGVIETVDETFIRLKPNK